jgi:hypothetical protein
MPGQPTKHSFSFLAKSSSFPSVRRAKQNSDKQIEEKLQKKKLQPACPAKAVLWRQAEKTFARKPETAAQP